MNESIQDKKLVHLLLRGDQLEEQDEYLKEFHRLHLTAASVPILQFRFVNQDHLKSKLLTFIGNKTNNGLIMTSPRAVKTVEEALNLIHIGERAKIISRIDPRLIFVVGQRTAREVESKIGVSFNKQSSDTGNFEALAKVIATECADYLTMTEGTIDLLYPISSMVTNVEERIRSTTRMQITPIISYETSTRPMIGAEIVRVLQGLNLKFANSVKTTPSELVINLIFFSPSGVTALVKSSIEKLMSDMEQLYPDCSLRLVYFSIGKTTEAELLKYGLKVAGVAKEPKPKALVDLMTSDTTF